MRAGPRSLRRAAGLLIGAALAAAARAQGDAALATAEIPRPADQERRWVPGVSVFGIGLLEERKASVQSHRGVLSGDTRAVIGGVGLSGELASPVLEAFPGRPRLFAHADGSFLPDPSEPVINEGDPGQPRITVLAGTSLRPLAGVQGRGSATRVQMQPFSFSAGVGLSFGLSAWERALRIKPSLEWQWQEDEVEALLADAESENPADPTHCDSSFGCRTLFISEKEVQGFHALGPGLEVETDAGRLGDFVFSVFASSGAYRVLSDRRLELTATGTWFKENGDPSARAPSSVTSTYERKLWQYRFGVGMRILWRPE